MLAARAVAHRAASAGRPLWQVVGALGLHVKREIEHRLHIEPCLDCGSALKERRVRIVLAAVHVVQMHLQPAESAERCVAQLAAMPTARIAAIGTRPAGWLQNRSAYVCEQGWMLSVFERGGGLRHR